MSIVNNINIFNKETKDNFNENSQSNNNLSNINTSTTSIKKKYSNRILNKTELSECKLNYIKNKNLYKKLII